MSRGDFYKAANSRRDLSELRSRCRKLERALKGLMADEEALARSSYSTFFRGRRVFNDVIWSQADPVTYRLWKAAKEALKR
jgi:hypothetical protein